MKRNGRSEIFHPHPIDAAGVLSWIHIGDLHMTRAGEQNDQDFQAIVAKINRLFAGSTSFVYLPGDIADDGGRQAYAVVTQSLDRLQAPWCAIVGDHDVHEKSFDNFLAAVSHATYYAFSVGRTRFLALNAFDEPHPAAFAILPRQFAWMEQELDQAAALGQETVLLLHCYPSELKVGSERLGALLRRYRIKLIDMGHTHYNEVANDGITLYTATRSTGQIEEGPVGFSVINLDNGVVSWRFLELCDESAVIITSPSDERLLLDAERTELATESALTVRAKMWTAAAPQRVWANIAGQRADLRQIAGSQEWEGTIPVDQIAGGAHSLEVRVEGASGEVIDDVIRIQIGAAPKVERKLRDIDNALAAWPEHGLLGTQLGPNKNGRKW